MNCLMQQYAAIKEKYKDAILLFRVGDFDEMFGEDATLAGKHMEVMVGETDGEGAVKRMASLPFYSLDNALRILTKAGYKVAVCDQLEAPKAGAMKRGVTELLNPQMKK